ncbi:hypothetical protein PPERSA_09511 [Pseudocohnilembus persalinus]|uniref:Uncharacterized protein n=1 Tax=Pseudocohnilembus persalinus TaxID=266149 RepID=A0A0V0QFD8_PSEPJ|nr:hypothetical protein PPERSA_09511 [Pseudocohnilembus persalinus]|eukprot:KRX00905.1 hypothetical protein PPERSA_09511 [Pseudocohnilembus persalinus]
MGAPCSKSQNQNQNLERQENEPILQNQVSKYEQDTPLFYPQKVEKTLNCTQNDTYLYNLEDKIKINQDNNDTTSNINYSQNQSDNRTKRSTVPFLDYSIMNSPKKMQQVAFKKNSNDLWEELNFSQNEQNISKNSQYQNNSNKLRKKSQNFLISNVMLKDQLQNLGCKLLKK